jgi:hypothetical protein
MKTWFKRICEMMERREAYLNLSLNFHEDGKDLNDENKRNNGIIKYRYSGELWSKKYVDEQARYSEANRELERKYVIDKDKLFKRYGKR